MDSLPIAFQLYLPETRANDPIRRTKDGIPDAVVFQTKPAIALDQIHAAVAAGRPPEVTALPPKPWSGTGRLPKLLRRGPGQQAGRGEGPGLGVGASGLAHCYAVSRLNGLSGRRGFPNYCEHDSLTLDREWG